MLTQHRGALLLLLAGCVAPREDPARTAATTAAAPGPAAFLPVDARPDYFAGLALASQPWVKAPSITDARDGLGPLYNAASCFSCHPRGGRGRPAGDDVVATVARLANDELLPDPVYGSQLQTRSIALADQLRVAPGVDLSLAPDEVAPEGRLIIAWKEERFTLADGTQRSLRRPEGSLERLGFGPLDPATRVVLRHAPPLWGLGLLARIPAEALARHADPDDLDADGISGRLPLVSDPAHEGTTGRFGWKSSQPSLRAQVAAALHADMGLTTALFPAIPCAEAQPTCRALPSGAGQEGVEVPEHLLASLVGFCDAVGVPNPPTHGEAAALARGKAGFSALGCAQCHTPTQQTGRDPLPSLSERDFSPYTDLLLHDLGPGLADARGEGAALPGEWRTAPLWGLGAERSADLGLLHDGRARTIEEAILWHGGEAAVARERFSRLSVRERASLLAFLGSL